MSSPGEKNIVFQIEWIQNQLWKTLYLYQSKAKVVWHQKNVDLFDSISFPAYAVFPNLMGLGLYEHWDSCAFPARILKNMVYNHIGVVSEPSKFCCVTVQ